MASDRRPRLVLAELAAWAVAGVGVLVAVAWFRVESDSALLIGLAGLAPLVLFLVWPAFAVMALARAVPRRAVAALVLAGLGCFHLFVLAQDLRFGFDTAERTPSSVRIVTANLYVGNDDQLAAIDGLLEEEPDILVLQEVRPGLLPVLADHPPLEDFTHRDVTDGGRGGRAVFSRLPLTDVSRAPLVVAEMITFVVSAGAVDVDVMTVHLAAPMGDEIDAWKSQLAELRVLAQRRERPLILVGDFNATSHHRSFRTLLDTGLHDAHQAAGSGFGFTWGPSFTGLPVMRIDHLLASEEIDVLAARTLDRRGSDHRPLVVDIRLPAAGP